MQRSLTYLALCLLLPLSAQAKATEIAPVIKAEKPVGTATMRVLWSDVYHASFWSDNGGWQQQPYALSLTYDMNFTADELADRTSEEMGKVSTLSETARTQYAERLKALWPNVKKGDRITAIARQNRTSFYHNGKALGSIEGGEFMRAFFGIWLSPNSSEPEMQRQLLAKPVAK